MFEFEEEMKVCLNTETSQNELKAIFSSLLDELIQQPIKLEFIGNINFMEFSTSRLWQSGMAKNITFIVTKDCQLACKYCYLVGKNSKERMTWEVAKQLIDYILEHEEDFREVSVIWDFIGGEPFLEIELIDKICDYLKTEMFKKKHHWFNSYRFSFSTNGINYHTDKVQNFIAKNKEHLSIGITIDGTGQIKVLGQVWSAVADSNIEKDSKVQVTAISGVKAVVSKM